MCLIGHRMFVTLARFIRQNAKLDAPFLGYGEQEGRDDSADIGEEKVEEMMDGDEEWKAKRAAEG